MSVISTVDEYCADSGAIYGQSARPPLGLWLNEGKACAAPLPLRFDSIRSRSFSSGSEGSGLATLTNSACVA